MKRHHIHDGIPLASFRDDSPSPQACAHCGAMLDAATETEFGKSRGPHAGAYTMCYYCQGIMVFDDDTLLRLPTEKELARLKASSAWSFFQRLQGEFAMRQAMRTNKQPRK